MQSSLAQSDWGLNESLPNSWFGPGVRLAWFPLPGHYLSRLHIICHIQQYLKGKKKFSKCDFLQQLPSFMSCFIVCFTQQSTVQNIPTLNHFLGSMTPWAHLLNNGSSKPACLFTTWLKKLLNFAQMTLPLPLKVEVALQWRCFSQGLIHSVNISQPFSFEIFDRTFLISVELIKKKQTRTL